MDEAALARWQARLLELLRRGEPPEAIRRALVHDPELEVLRDRANALDLHALVVAGELVAKWRPDRPR
jgi:hypothetical protein